MNDSKLSTEEKAALWDGLMSCDRIRLLGYARGGRDGKRGPINHLGLELWKTFPVSGSVPRDTARCREILTEFARGDDKSSTGQEPA